jgi:hypothetical protein
MKNSCLLGNVDIFKFNTAKLIRSYKMEVKDKEDSSFERFRHDKNQFIPPSSDSSAVYLTDKAAESEGCRETGPIDYFKFSRTSWNSTNNIFERLYHEAKIKTKKRDELTQATSEVSKSKTRMSNASKLSVKIEDKLMHKHIHATLKLDKMRKEKEIEEMK